MTPMNGSSVPRRGLMDRIACAHCGRTATAGTVKREGWTPIAQGARIVAAVCRKCSS